MRGASSSLANRPSLLEYGPFRFLIMDAPTNSNVGAYLTHLQKHSMSRVVRACEHTYSPATFESAGVIVNELPFDDGAPPPDKIVDQWLDIVTEQFHSRRSSGTHDKNDVAPGIAVHCVAGLGRAPVLVAIALIEYGMDAFDAIELIRKKRRGAINARQLVYLESYQRRRGMASRCGAKCTIL